MRTPLFFQLLLALTWTQNTWAQSAPERGLLPAIYLRHNLGSDWALNFKWESRHLSLPQSEGLTYELSDFALLAVKRVSLRSSIAGGYLLRLENGLPMHRLLQQWSWVKAQDYISWAHRIASDQSKAREEAWSLRLRYRLAGELALQGRHVDPGEFFLKAHQEFLGESQANKQSYSARSGLFSGYLLSRDIKIEGGIEYRYPIQQKSAEPGEIWWALNLYAKI